MPDAQQQRTRQVIAFLLIAAASFALASLLDRWSYLALVDLRVYERDWGRMFRIVGYVPTWALLAAALVMHDRVGIPADRWRRGGLLLGSAIAGGLAAEGLKLLLRRERPRATGGLYEFRPFTQDPFGTGGLGLPSSHALVAFAAAAMLARLFPRATPIWFLFAIGCGITRVMSQAHFLSDVVLAGFVGYAVAWLLWRRFAPAPERPAASPVVGEASAGAVR